MRKDNLSNPKLNYPLTNKTWHLQACVKPRLYLVPLSELIPHLKMWQCKHPDSRWFGRGGTPKEAYENWACLHSQYGIYHYLPEEVLRLREKRQLREMLEHD